MHKLTDHFSARMLAALLALALVCAQWSGLAHRVAHGSLVSPAASIELAGVDNADKASIEHSCSLFDAATLGASLDSPAFVPPSFIATRSHALWLAFTSWLAPFHCSFSSRAPPR